MQYQSCQQKILCSINRVINEEGYFQALFWRLSLLANIIAFTVEFIPAQIPSPPVADASQAHSGAVLLMCYGQLTCIAVQTKRNDALGASCRGCRALPLCQTDSQMVFWFDYRPAALVNRYNRFVLPCVPLR